MTVIQVISSQVSRLLDKFIFSFPTPSSNATLISNLSSSIIDFDDLAEKNQLSPAMAELVREPGEPRALAAGIGPLSFAGSGYGIMLIFMGILLNRIHHIVRRPRIPPAPQPHPPIASTIWKIRHKLSRFLSDPDTPKYLRMPGIFSLVRAWTLLSIVTLQVANLWPVNTPTFLGSHVAGVIKRYGDWAGGMEMERACWQIFLSVCSGLVCSGLANGLDRGPLRNAGAGFNLFGYSFLLHLYSSPMTHHRPPPSASFGRPDIHVLLQLWISLTELTWMQANELFESTRHRQLLPTGVCDSLGLLHFVYVLSTSPLKFPSFTFLTHLLALFLSVIILTTMLLRAFTFIFTIGYIPSPVFLNLLPHEGVIPSLEDDFGTMLLKVGTACMRSSQFGGMKNELIHIPLRPGPFVTLNTDGGSISIPNTFNSIRNNGSYEGDEGLGAGGGVGGFKREIKDIKVIGGEEDPDQVEPKRWTEMKNFWKAFGTVIINMIIAGFLLIPGSGIAIKVSKKIWGFRWWYGPRGWRFWRRDAWRYEGDAARRLREGQRLAAALGRRPLPVPRPVNASTTAIPADVFDSTGITTAVQAGPSSGVLTVPYHRYLRGEVELEDDDEEWQDDNEEEGFSVTSEDGEENISQYGGREGEEMEDEPSFRDFLPDSDEDNEALQQVLIAHLTSSSSSPLTRRRYNNLLLPSHPASSSSSQALTPQSQNLQSHTPTRTGQQQMLDISQERRLATADKLNDEWDEERRKSCVICTIEPRDTILWPCRCLAVCNDCRESLGDRLTPKDHLCPCCRRKVEGYSRIFVP